LEKGGTAHGCDCITGISSAAGTAAPIDSGRLS
jgi:hypothetical protein